MVKGKKHQQKMCKFRYVSKTFEKTCLKQLLLLQFHNDWKKWDSIYEKKNHNGNYPFSVDNVKEFSEFCKNSGGFTIG